MCLRTGCILDVCKQLSMVIAGIGREPALRGVLDDTVRAVPYCAADFGAVLECVGGSWGFHYYTGVFIRGNYSSLYVMVLGTRVHRQHRNLAL